MGQPIRSIPGIPYGVTMPVDTDPEGSGIRGHAVTENHFPQTKGQPKGYVLNHYMQLLDDHVKKHVTKQVFDSVGLRVWAAVYRANMDMRNDVFASLLDDVR